MVKKKSRKDDASKSNGAAKGKRQESVEFTEWTEWDDRHSRKKVEAYSIPHRGVWEHPIPAEQIDALLEACFKIRIAKPPNKTSRPESNTIGNIPITPLMKELVAEHDMLMRSFSPGWEGEIDLVQFQAEQAIKYALGHWLRDGELNEQGDYVLVFGVRLLCTLSCRLRPAMEAGDVAEAAAAAVEVGFYVAKLYGTREILTAAQAVSSAFKAAKVRDAKAAARLKEIRDKVHQEWTEGRSLGAARQSAFNYFKRVNPPRPGKRTGYSLKAIENATKGWKKSGPLPSS